jgi:hypothetical protein
MCPGVDSAFENEYQFNPRGKGGQKSGGFNLLEPCGPVQACNGTAILLVYSLMMVTME